MRERNAINQQQDGDKTEHRHALNEQNKERAETGVILGEHHAGDLQQRDFADHPAYLHIDEGKQVGQQQHEQRRQRPGGGALSRRLPVGRERGAAARAIRFMSLRQRRQGHHHVALWAQNMLCGVVVFTHARLRY